jgi:hypothetical protein
LSTNEKDTVVVDSQALQWLHIDVVGSSSVYDLKPDLFFVKFKVFEQYDEYGGTTQYNAMRKLIESNKSKNTELYYYYGKLPWALKQMVRMVIEVKVDMHDGGLNKNVGQIASYLNFLSKKDMCNVYHGILMDNNQAYMFDSFNGVIKHGKFCENLHSPGSLELLSKFLNPKSYLQLALEYALSDFGLDLSVESNFFLGAGRDGHVFKVYFKPTQNASTNNSPMALKILIDKSTNIRKQDLRLMDLQECAVTVNVLRNVQYEFDLDVSARCYLIKEVGEIITKAEATKAFTEIMDAVYNFHFKTKQAHGDCRLANIIYFRNEKYPDQKVLLFIDVECSIDFFAAPLPQMMINDAIDMVKSIYSFLDVDLLMKIFKLYSIDDYDSFQKCCKSVCSEVKKYELLK